MREILQRLLDNKLFVKAEKCEFHVDTVAFLGFLITQGNLKTDPVTQ